MNGRPQGSLLFQSLKLHNQIKFWEPAEGRAFFLKPMCAPRDSELTSFISRIKFTQYEIV